MQLLAELIWTAGACAWGFGCGLWAANYLMEVRRWRLWPTLGTAVVVNQVGYWILRYLFRG